MGRKSQINGKTLNAALQLRKKANTVEELRMSLAIILPEHFKISLAEAAEIIGVSEATVSRLRMRLEIIQGTKVSPREKWGGRRRGNLSEEKESEFLKKWEEKTRDAPLKSLRPVYEEYKKLISRDVPKSTVYRLLKRNGWEKKKGNNLHKGWTPPEAS